MPYSDQAPPVGVGLPTPPKELWCVLHSTRIDQQIMRHTPRQIGLSRVETPAVGMPAKFVSNAIALCALPSVHFGFSHLLALEGD